MWPPADYFTLGILIHLISLLNSVIWCYECHPSRMCSCEEEKIVCDCNDSDVLLRLTRYDLESGLTSLSVRNCHKFKLAQTSEAGSYQRLKIREYVFENIREFHIEKKMFANPSNISLMRFENIGNLTFEKGLYWNLEGSLDILVMKHVQIQSLGLLAFPSGFKVNKYLIQDSTIDKIATHDIKIKGGKEFIMLNTTVKVIDFWGITIEDFKEVNFIKNGFETIKTESIFVYNTDSLQFTKCNIHTIHSSMFIKYGIQPVTVQNFRFEDNVIGHLREGAFRNLKVISNGFFAHNRIGSAENDSLIPNKGFTYLWNTIFNIQNNSFSCNCSGLEWLWHDPLYQDLLKRSTCYEPNNLKGKSLGQLDRIELSKNRGNKCPSRSKGNWKDFESDGAAAYTPGTLFGYLLLSCILTWLLVI